MQKWILYDGLKSVAITDEADLFATGDELTVNRAYRTVPWVRRCVYLRANAISGLPHEILSGDEPIDWPLGHLLPELLWLTEASLCLTGAAYWLKERRGRVLIGLRHLAAATITPLLDTERGLVGFQRTVGARTLKFSPDDVVYFFEPSPDVEVGPGRPLLEAALEAAGIAANANQFVSQFFRRGAITATLLAVEGNPPAEELRRLETWWKQMLRGVRRAWETVAVRATVKPQQIGVSPGKDLAVDGLLAAARQQIAVAFGIPQTLLEDAANYATAAEHRRSFYQETVLPRAAWLEGILNEQLFYPLGLRFRFRPDLLEIFQQDEMAKAQALVALVQAGIMTTREARLQLGLEEPTEEGQAEGLAEAEAEEEMGETKSLPPDDADALRVKALLYDLRRWRDKARRADRENDQQAALEFKSDVIPPRLAGHIRATLEQGEDPFGFLRNLRADAAVKVEPDREYERELRERILDVFRAYLDGVLEAKSEAEALAALEGFGDGMRRAIEPVLVRIVTDVALAEAVAVGLYPDIVAINRAALEWAAVYSYELISGLTDTTREVVRHAITSFLATPGMTVGDLRAMLEPAFGKVRAEMIAITEVTRAVNQATRIYQQLIREWGLEMARIWRTSHDKLVCPVCSPNEGKPEWDWTFPEGPPAHPRCRCWTTLEMRRRK